MTPLRTMFYGGLGAALVLAIVGAGWWGITRSRADRATAASAARSTAIWGRNEVGAPSPINVFARFTLDDVTSEFAARGIRLGPEHPVSRKYWFDNAPSFGIESRTFAERDANNLSTYVTVFVYDNETDLVTMRDYLARRLISIGSVPLILAPEFVRNHNVIIVYRGVSPDIRTVFLGMR